MNIADNDWQVWHRELSDDGEVFYHNFIDPDATDDTVGSLDDVMTVFCHTAVEDSKKEWFITPFYNGAYVFAVEYRPVMVACHIGTDPEIIFQQWKEIHGF